MARLLVVEDHADVRAMLGEHLAAQGHQVESCGDGRRAVDLVRAEPFDLGELAARVEVALRRARPGAAPARLVSGPLVLHLDAASLTVDGRPVALTGTELRLLQALMERPGVVLSKAGLYEQVWGEPFVGDEASVKAHVSNLRGKLRQAGAPDDLGLDPRRLAPPPRAWPGSPGSVW